MAERAQTQVKPTVAPVLPVAGGSLQRQCACGTHTLGDQCDSCKGGAGLLQRKAAGRGGYSEVPPIVHEVLRSPGQPLDASTRAFFEPRFGHDFSQIVTHTPAIGVRQNKLAIGEPGDEYEQEADRLADQVLAAPSHAGVSRSIPRIHRFAGQPVGQTETAPASVSNVLVSSGRPLDLPLRQDMEQRFGYDFSHVRLHSGPAAEQSAHDVGALAYTVGHDIVFGAGQFVPGTHEGQRLIAHELTHVVQQTGGDRRLLDQRNETPRPSPARAISEPAHATLQLRSDHQVLSRKCDVEPALKYYKTPPGKKIAFGEWLEKMRKVAGPANKTLYDNAKAAGNISHSFIILVCRIQELLNIPEDGKIGGTTATAFDKFATGGKKGIDYTRLFNDKKLEVGIAIGAEVGEFDGLVKFVEEAGKALKNFSSTGSKGSRVIKFTKEFPVQGDNTAPPITIEVVFSIISAESATPKESFTGFLSQQEIVIYSGHARMGTGPDFDAKESVEKNFIIGVNSALHKAGKLSKGYDAHMNEVLEGYGNDLEAMSKTGKIDPEKYQVWFFNACSSIQYLDEIRQGLVTDKSGKTKSKANLRIAGTKASISSDAIKIVDSILKMKTMDELISIMDINEKALPKEAGEKPRDSYFFSD